MSVSIDLVYFSPTKTTARTIEAVAEGFGPDEIEKKNLTSPGARNAEAIPLEKDLIIIGAPVYGGRVPAIAVEAFQKLKGDGQPAILIVVYGNREYEDALLELKDLATKAGLKPIAGGAFIGEHTYATKEFPVALNRPDEADLAKARNLGNQIRKLYDETDSIADLPDLSVPGNFPYKERKPARSIVPETMREICALCRTCADSCPTEAITINAFVETDEAACIACCACVKSCPENARVIENPLIHKVRQWLNDSCGERKEPVTFTI